MGISMKNDLLHLKKYCYCLVLWCDSTTYNYQYTLQQINWLYFKGKIKHYSYIKHDKDKNDITGELEKPHIHLVFNLFQQWTCGPMLKELGLPQDLCNKHIFCNSYNGYVKYLTHSNITSKSKQLYSLDDVFSDDKDYLANVTLNEVEEASECFINFCEWVHNYDKIITYYMAIQHMYELGKSNYMMFLSKQYNYLCTRLIDEHNRGMKYYD